VHQGVVAQLEADDAPGAVLDGLQHPAIAAHGEERDGRAAAAAAAHNAGHRRQLVRREVLLPVLRHGAARLQRRQAAVQP
jgi:hypothetical protein